MTSPESVLTSMAHEHRQIAAFDDGKQRLGYGQLLERVSVSSVHRRCVPTQRLAFFPNNDLQTLQTFWSIFAAGGVACPLSRRLPKGKAVEIAARLGAVSVEHDKADAPLLRTLSFTRTVDAGTIILSSGSTGEPKAVVHSLAAHIASAVGAASNISLNAGDRWLWSLPSYHVSGLSILVRCAVAGATVVGQGKATITPGLLNDLGVTHLSVVATQLWRLLADPSFPGHCLKSVLLGGSAAPRRLIEAAMERGVPLHTTYGLTEMASQVTTTAVDDPADAVARTSGRILPGRELRISPDGEILVRGETLCLGYDHCGIVKSVGDEDGWFATGDLGELDAAGYLVVTGRRDNMFISGGENIHPETIEKALLQIPGVRQAMVVPKNDAEFGHRPVAFVEADAWSPETWQEQLRCQVSSFAVPVDYLPWPKLPDEGIKPKRSELQRRVG